ncbi:succinate-semialdehyde dehydrogenase [Bacterioplanes sanyensis]|uniref:Succinate-semialdehyde dehydrogenase n=1 Tax=Bacterioplanes sanyensis TaxID=1249553 RepID=A0A222FJA8_9GAMM|nr:NAD-dependent succinate-semialdehyde dehydrogenase [Bacterioplanes sanyensis]ASP38313.1 succinate-semialdehyde dehydrogenase [Bacterioplanes sanyensis]
MSYQSINPATGECEWQQPYLDEQSLEERLQALPAANRQWSALSVSQRGAYLMALAQQLRLQQSSLAGIMTAEMGKKTSEAEAEIEKSAQVCEYYAKQALDMLAPESLPASPSDAYLHFEPIGTVLAIMPWNFPIWQVMRCAAPTLMAGNTLALKHAENVPRCADMLQTLFVEAGFPEAVFSNLFIDNETCAQVIADDRIAAVTLTGSERAGRSVAASAGKALKKSVLELGGSDAFVVLDGADVEQAATTAVKSRFMNAGQVCIAAKRFILHPKVADAFIAAFVQHAKSLQLAPMARRDLRDQLQQQVDDSVAAGATRLLGGYAGSGYADYPATVLDQVPTGCPAYEQELFGPVAAMIRAQDDQDAVRIANATRFGLGASVWGPEQEARAMAHHIVAGCVVVNGMVRSDQRLPFGGTKQSGYGRELAQYGMREFTNMKTLIIDR